MSSNVLLPYHQGKEQHIRTNFPLCLCLFMAGKAPCTPAQSRMKVTHAPVISNNL